jgi:hypothetical protein
MKIISTIVHGHIDTFFSKISSGKVPKKRKMFYQKKFSTLFRRLVNLKQIGQVGII